MSAAEERLGNDPTSELWGEHRARYRFALQWVGGRRVLDVACGAGFGLQMLRSSVPHAIGADLDRGALAEARRIDRGAALLRADALRLPLPEGSIDAITSFETIEHVPDAAALVRELRRVLRPGGALVLSTPNREFGPQSLHAGNPFHIREFTAAELRDLLRECFADVHIYGQWPTSVYRFVPFLMIEPDLSPAAIAWKLQNRLPFAFKDGLARAISGRSFYPGENDYAFELDRIDGAHAMVAVAR